MPITAQVIINIVVSALFGGVVSAVVTYFLRRRGKVRCIVPAMGHSYVSRPSAAYDVIDVAFILRFYNEREVGTSISDLVLDLYKAGTHVTGDAIREVGANTNIMFLDLPPQASVWREIGFRMEVRKGLNQEEGALVFKLRWTYPDGKVERQKIPRVPAFDEPKAKVWVRQLFRHWRYQGWHW